MKKLFLILVILCGGFYFIQSNSSDILSVSEVINDTSNSNIVLVEGIVTNNFKLVIGLYELNDVLTKESIIVKTNNKLPVIGTTITRKLQSNDIITLNDKKFSFYTEIE